MIELDKKRRAAMSVELRDIKLASGCVDCGYKADADGLQFDHRDEGTKLFNVSQFSSRSIGVIRAEVEKCDVRCGTCHAIRSASRHRARNLQNLPTPELLPP